MAKTLKLRFMTMLITHGSMTRAGLTRRALGQIRQLNMVKLKRMLTKLKKENLIEIQKRPQHDKPGLNPDHITITQDGRNWVRDETA